MSADVSHPIRYAGLARRAAAVLIDGTLIFILYLFVYAKLYRHSLTAAMVVQVLFFIVFFTYLIVSLWLCGRTLGKWVMGVKVTRLDGSRLRLRDAIMRSSVDMGYSIAGIVIHVMALAAWQGGDWALATAEQRNAVLQQWHPAIGTMLTVLTWTWMIAEVIVLVRSRRRRAIHDFIAGTVVIQTRISKETGRDPDYPMPALAETRKKP